MHCWNVCNARMHCCHAVILSAEDKLLVSCIVVMSAPPDIFMQTFLSCSTTAAYISSCLQMVEVIWLILQKQYWYPILIWVISFPILHGSMALLKQRHNQVMTLMNEIRLTPMVQGQWVRATCSHRLVPGDVIVLQTGRALCDMVILRGACMVTESRLSGEASTCKASRLCALYHSICNASNMCT